MRFDRRNCFAASCSSLEDQLYGQLNVSQISLASDFAEAGVGWIQIKIAELSVIECFEKLAAEDQETRLMRPSKL